MTNKVIQTFTKGINGDASPFMLDPSTLADATNVLFERGMMVTRPPLSAVGLGLPGGETLLQVIGLYTWVPLVLAITTTDGAPPYVNCKLYTLSFTSSPYVATEITGPGFTYSTLAGMYGRYAIINQAVLIPVTAGLIRWVPGAAVYTIVGSAFLATASNVTAHNFHAIAADAQLIRWSASGNETQWDPATYPTAGSTTLPDAQITGIGVIHDTLVLINTREIIVGVPTGHSQPPYDWKTYIKGRFGSALPESIIFTGDEAFYIGDSNIYRFDLNSKPREIGEGILKNYNPRGGLSLYKGLYAPSYTFDSRPMYILMPRGTYTAASRVFLYDIREEKWSIHHYEELVGQYLLPTTSWTSSIVFPITQLPAVAARNGNIYLWNGFTSPVGNLGATHSFETGRITLGDVDTEYTSVRLIAMVYSSGAITATFELTALLDGTDTTITKTRTLAAGWNRKWVDFIMPGNFFKIKVIVPANIRLEWRMLLLKVGTGTAEVRNV